MFERCSETNRCEYFINNRNSEDIINKGIISVYCSGIKYNQCSRKVYFDRNGYFPYDDVSPMATQKCRSNPVIIKGL